MFLAENTLEAHGHAQKQPTPVHGGACHHAVVAVPARVEQVVEAFPVDGMYALAADTEQAEGEYQLDCRDTLGLLHGQTAEKMTQPKAGEQGKKIGLKTVLTLNTLDSSDKLLIFAFITVFSLIVGP